MFEVDDPQLLCEVEEREATKQGLMNYKHPCTCCYGAKRYNCHIIKKKLRYFSHDPYFQWPMVVGDSPYKNECTWSVIIFFAMIEIYNI